MKVRSLVAAAVVAAAPVLLPATQAFAATSDNAPCCVQTHCQPCPPPPCWAPCESPWDLTRTLAGQQDIFDMGGAELGDGAAKIISGGVLGLEDAVLKAPALLTGAPNLNYIP
jgi:hypothetical protein